jgi:hypothetical protein
MKLKKQMILEFTALPMSIKSPLVHLMYDSSED